MSLSLITRPTSSTSTPPKDEAALWDEVKEAQDKIHENA
jgi:hypothetical protein